MPSNEPTPLEPGRFFGVNRSERRVSGLILSEAHYRPELRVPPHVHQRAYFGFLVGGGYWEELGRRAITCAPLSVVFHPPREVRRGVISQGGARMFHAELPDTWMERVRELGVVPDEAFDHHRGPLVQLARSLYREFRHPDASSPIVIEGIALEMLGGLLRGRVASDRGAPWIGRARELLHARALDAPGLDEVAAELGVAPIRLARAFRRTYGESPGQYLRRERIRAACQRMAEPGVSLAAIAAELGFTDQSHFTRVFRKQVGTTPGAWRRDNVPPRRGRGW
ncbi:MAG TPA: AraC family transcriptional regulator [Kofleriaceae bacterium]|nr:AraC family transcriptional regulator [Kofleriaceae bacterium]